MKFIYIILFLSLLVLNSYSKENNINLIIRKVVILPVKNDNNNKNYEYLSSLFTEYLIASYDLGFSVVKNNLDFYIKKDTELNKDKAKEISYITNADIAIYGNMSIIGDLLSINLKTYDAIKDIVIDNIDVRYSVNGDINLILKSISDNFYYKIKEKLSIYDQELVEIIKNIEKLDKNRKGLLESLIKINNNTYWNYIVQNENQKILVLIPFLKNSVIFIGDNSKDFSIESENIKIENNSNIKVFSSDNKPGKNRIFKIRIKNLPEFSYDYKQINIYEINTKFIKLTSDIKPKSYKFFLDNSIVGTTSGIFGYDLKFGTGIPFNTNLDNNFYIRAFLGIKGINVAQINGEDTLIKPNFKFRLSAGFEHIFNFKNIIGLQLGFDIGYEMYIFSDLITDNGIYYFDRSFWGYPGINLSIPFAIHFFKNSKYNLIIGFEPVLRFALSYFMYSGKVWTEYIDKARGAGMEFLRVRIDNNATLDLFIYDMPIFISFRIKL